MDPVARRRPGAGRGRGGQRGAPFCPIPAPNSPISAPKQPHRRPKANPTLGVNGAKWCRIVQPLKGGEALSLSCRPRLRPRAGGRETADGAQPVSPISPAAPSFPRKWGTYPGASRLVRNSGTYRASRPVRNGGNPPIAARLPTANPNRAIRPLRHPPLPPLSCPYDPRAQCPALRTGRPLSVAPSGPISASSSPKSASKRPVLAPNWPHPPPERRSKWGQMMPNGAAI